MQKKVKLEKNEEKVSVEMNIGGKIICYYEMRLYEKNKGKIDVFEGDNFYSNDDTYTLPDNATQNIDRTLLIDIAFHSKDIPPQADDIANFKIEFRQGNKLVDTISISEKLTGTKQFSLVLVKFIEN